MTLPALIIFDCDGVLVDSEPVSDAVIAESLQSFGVTDTDTLLSWARGRTMSEIRQRVIDHGVPLPEDWAADIHSEMYARLRQGVDVIDGVRTLLDTLDRHGILTAVASNAPLAKMEITLGDNALWDRFDGRIFSGHDHKPKPDPEMLQRILDTTGIAPASAVMIDDMPVGRDAAAAAGTGFLGYAAAGDPARFGTSPYVTTLHHVAPRLGLASGPSKLQ